MQAVHMLSMLGVDELLKQDILSVSRGYLREKGALVLQLVQSSHENLCVLRTHVQQPMIAFYVGQKTPACLTKIMSLTNCVLNVAQLHLMKFRGEL